MITLNQQQRDAVDKMHEFLASDEKMLLLEGSAGTGKTTCIQTLVKECPGVSFALTAPTNKATKVLKAISESEGAEGVHVRTIYSLLGLRVSKDSEFVQVEALADSDAGRYQVVVVDEASMVSEKLFSYIHSASRETPVKFIFMGDHLQLPPVGEPRSPTYEVKNRVKLTQVMRHDNQILRMATHLRDVIETGCDLKIASDFDDNGGVYCVNWKTLRKHLTKAYTSENYELRPGSIKTVAWRNAQVQSYNEFIREEIYKEAASELFVVNERVVVTHPIPKIGDPELFAMVTDEEATITQLKVEQHPMFPEIKVYILMMEPEFGAEWACGFVVHPESRRAYDRKLGELADMAKARKISWKSFWEFKNTYFHDIRPSHAITAHRSQGSTYESAFVDVEDILSNQNRQEALRCLYVAATRPSRVLVLKTR